MRNERTASPPRALLALLLPLALLAARSGSQYLGGLYPCEMCHWQRWPHYAAIVARAARLRRARRRRDAQRWSSLAALLIAVSRARSASIMPGVEYHWWQGFTACTSTVVAARRRPTTCSTRDHERAAGPLRRSRNGRCSASRSPASTRSSRSAARSPILCCWRGRRDERLEARRPRDARPMR